MEKGNKTLKEIFDDIVSNGMEDFDGILVFTAKGNKVGVYACLEGGEMLMSPSSVRICEAMHDIMNNQLKHANMASMIIDTMGWSSVEKEIENDLPELDQETIDMLKEALKKAFEEGV